MGSFFRILLNRAQPHHKNMNLCLLSEETTDFGTFKIPKKVSPAPVPEYEDNNNVDLLQYCLKRDIA